LHEQWREIGPVAAEHRESIWERFKEASSRINRQHQEYFEGIKEEQKKNLALKTELCEKAEALSSEMLTTRKEWNKASERLIEIQKVWKTIGFAPKKDNTKIYERFRSACDRFFELKRAFYEGIKTEMEHNLQLKVEICEAAEAIKDSEQWKKSSDELISLQKRWKEIGPVSRRHSDAVWKRFRAACDHFFARKGAHFAGVDAEHADNLAKKTALLEEIESFDITGGSIESIKEFQRRWSEIGYVPIKEKEALQKRYRAAIDKLFAVLRNGDRERGVERFRNKINGLKGQGGKLRNERERLYNKVKQLESDIATLENNIGFFSRSKGAEALIRDVENKIQRAKQEMAETIEKINLIDNQQE
jgi:exonuclease VII small subunit